MFNAHLTALNFLSELSVKYSSLFAVTIDDFGNYVCGVETKYIGHKASSCYGIKHLKELRKAAKSHPRSNLLFTPILSFRKQIPQNIYQNGQMGKIFGVPFRLAEEINLNYRFLNPRLHGESGAMTAQLKFFWSDYFGIEKFIDDCRHRLVKEVFINDSLILSRSFGEIDFLSAEDISFDISRLGDGRM